jgi:hypothetical protein
VHPVPQTLFDHGCSIICESRQAKLVRLLLLEVVALLIVQLLFLFCFASLLTYRVTTRKDMPPPFLTLEGLA